MAAPPVATRHVLVAYVTDRLKRDCSAYLDGRINWNFEQALTFLGTTLIDMNKLYSEYIKTIDEIAVDTPYSMSSDMNDEELIDMLENEATYGIFGQGIVNWQNIASVFNMMSQLVSESAQNGLLDRIKVIIDWCVDYFQRPQELAALAPPSSIDDWIAEQRGWANIPAQPPVAAPPLAVVPAEIKKQKRTLTDGPIPQYMSTTLPTGSVRCNRQLAIGNCNHEVSNKSGNLYRDMTTHVQEHHADPTFCRGCGSPKTRTVGGIWSICPSCSQFWCLKGACTAEYKTHAHLTRHQTKACRH